MATNSSIGPNLVWFHRIGMQSAIAHEVTFNNGLTTYFCTLTNSIVMELHTFDDCVFIKKF